MNKIAAKNSSEDSSKDAPSAVELKKQMDTMQRSPKEISEALQEKKLAHIADQIAQRKKEIKVVFISGPSSSGKTTFAKRLSVQLSVIGLRPQILSMDNYFVDRASTPLDENGEYDFENPFASNCLSSFR